MKKRLVLTTVFAMFFGCVVSFADVSPRGGNKGPEKPKTVKVDNKRDNKKPAAQKPATHKPAPKPNNKPVAHKPAPKPAPKPVAHKPNHKPEPRPVAHRPAPKPAPVCHLNHRHDNHCCKPAPKCNLNHHHNDHCHDVVVVNPLNPVAVGAVTTAVTTAAVVGLVSALVH